MINKVNAVPTTFSRQGAARQILITSRVNLLLVFDGPPPLLKRQTLLLRAQQRDSEERQRRKVVEKLLRNQLKMHILEASSELNLVAWQCLNLWLCTSSRLAVASLQHDKYACLSFYVVLEM